MSGKKAGETQREFMDAAYLQLNQWEQAGASATTAGVQSAQNDVQLKMQKNQLKNQLDIAKLQTRTQKEVAGLQSATQLSTTSSQLAPVMDKLPTELKILAEELENLKGAKSTIGKIYDDIKTVAPPDAETFNTYVKRKSAEFKTEAEENAERRRMGSKRHSSNRSRRSRMVNRRYELE